MELLVGLPVGPFAGSPVRKAIFSTFWPLIGGDKPRPYNKIFSERIRGDPTSDIPILINISHDDPGRDFLFSGSDKPETGERANRPT
jgi:hypothetical protein